LGYPLTTELYAFMIYGVERQNLSCVIATLL